MHVFSVELSSGCVPGFSVRLLSRRRALMLAFAATIDDAGIDSVRISSGRIYLAEQRPDGVPARDDDVLGRMPSVAATVPVARLCAGV
jgi:hypothetical protein